VRVARYLSKEHRPTKFGPVRPKRAQRMPKGRPRALQGEPKGAKGAKPSSEQTNAHEKYTMATQPKGNVSSVHQFEKWESTLRICLVTLYQQHHVVCPKISCLPMVHTVSCVPLVWPKDTRNDLYRKSKDSVGNKQELLKMTSLKSVGKLFPHPVGVFCSLLEPPKCHIRRGKNNRFYIDVRINSRSTTHRDSL